MRTFKKLMLIGLIGFALALGVPIRPEQMEELFRLLHQPRIVRVVSDKNK